VAWAKRKAAGTVEIDGRPLYVSRAGDGWVVRYEKRELTGRSLVALLEELFGRGDQDSLRVALDALIRDAYERTDADTAA
jgi:hypothetical protein